MDLNGINFADGTAPAAPPAAPVAQPAVNLTATPAPTTTPAPAVTPPTATPVTPAPAAAPTVTATIPTTAEAITEIIAAVPADTADDVPAAPAKDIYAQRRRRIVLGAGIAVAVIFASQLTNLRSVAFQNPTSHRAGMLPALEGEAATSPEAIAAQQGAATMVITEALNAAVGYQAERGTFDGFGHPNVRSAGSRTTLLVTADVNGTCWWSAIAPGAAREILPNPSGSGCTDAGFTAAAAELSAAEGAQIAADIDVANAALTSAADQAAYWVRSAPYGPNFTGLDEVGVDGAEIVEIVEISPDGNHVVFQARLSDGRCILSVLAVNGTSHQAGPEPCR